MLFCVDGPSFKRQIPDMHRSFGDTFYGDTLYGISVV